MSRPPLLDPQAVPVIGTDAHLPPVDPRRLGAAALRERFAAPHAFEPEIAGDAALVQRDPSSACACC